MRITASAAKQTSKPTTLVADFPIKRAMTPDGEAFTLKFTTEEIDLRGRYRMTVEITRAEIDAMIYSATRNLLRRVTDLEKELFDLKRGNDETEDT